MTTGKVVKVTSDPKGFLVHKDDPPPGGTDVAFVDVTADQFAVALAAYGKDSTVDVDGVPPNCTKIEAR
jgi:hypothetical protein